MNRARSIRRSTLRLLVLPGLIVLLFGALASPMAALAHPLDEYLQATYLTVAPTRIEVELDLTPGVLIAPQILAMLDTDGDQQISAAESRAYADTVVRQLMLRVDGQPLALTIASIEMPPYLNIQTGYGTIRIFATATLPDDMTGTHLIFYANNYAPIKSAYQVNTFVDRGAPITLGRQHRDDVQQTLRVEYTMASSLDVATASRNSTAAAILNGATERQASLLAYVALPALSPWLLVTALGLAAVLGGLHALTPGHGKTLLAAYLVGSRGTARHALALGGIVTFTHTASVIAIGLITLLASHFIVPNLLVPILEISAGLLVTLLGVRLVRLRWRSRQHDHDHDHHHDHDHDHDHDHHLHDHTHDHAHHHPAPADHVRWRDLLAMGVSGGLIPCPEALGVLLLAIGLNRIALGLGLITAFSLGLAAVLCVIGLLLVRARNLVDRLGRQGRRVQRFLPLGSAVIVTLLGLGIFIKGVLTYFA